jgi:hypothetical protein
MQEYKMELVESLRALTRDEYKDLEENCLEHGVLDEIKVWNGYLVDGRHRLKIAKKHNLATHTKEMEFADIEEARLWVLKNQVGKRNLSESEVAYIRGTMAKMTSPAEVAEAFDVSERTVYRDIEMADSMDKASKGFREKCLSGEIINSKKDWEEFSTLQPLEASAVEQRIKENPHMTLRDALPKTKRNPKADDLEAINKSKYMSPEVKRRVASGVVVADHQSIKKLSSLAPEKQELLSSVLEDPEVTSVKQGLMIVQGEIRPKSTSESLRFALMSITPLCERIEERLSDLDAAGFNTAQCRVSLKQFLTQANSLKAE